MDWGCVKDVQLTVTDLLSEVLEERCAGLDVMELEDSFEDLGRFMISYGKEFEQGRASDLRSGLSLRSTVP